MAGLREMGKEGKRERGNEGKRGRRKDYGRVTLSEAKGP
jgi:hypothetical protein